MMGVVVDVKVVKGAKVVVGQPLVVLSAMKVLTFSIVVCELMFSNLG